jgi:hypothetical protein
VTWQDPIRELKAKSCVHNVPNQLLPGAQKAPRGIKAAKTRLAHERGEATACRTCLSCKIVVARQRCAAASSHRLEASCCGGSRSARRRTTASMYRLCVAASISASHAPWPRARTDIGRKTRPRRRRTR